MLVELPDTLLSQTPSKSFASFLASNQQKSNYLLAPQMAGRDTMKTLGRAAGVSLLTATALVAVQVLRIADQTVDPVWAGSER